MSSVGSRCLGTPQWDPDVGDAPMMSSMGPKRLGTSGCPQWDPDTGDISMSPKALRCFGDFGMSPMGPKCWGCSDDAINGTQVLGTPQCPQWDPNVGDAPMMSSMGPKGLGTLGYWGVLNGTQMLGGPPRPPKCPHVRLSVRQGWGHSVRGRGCACEGEPRTHACVYVCESCAHACAAVAVGCWGRWGGGVGEGRGGGGPCPGTGVRCTRVCPGGDPAEQHPPVPGSHSSRSSSSLGHSAEATRRSSVFWGGGGGGGDTNGSSPWGQQ